MSNSKPGLFEGNCPKCHGAGVVSVYFGRYGGSVECDLCGGDGNVA